MISTCSALIPKLEEVYSGRPLAEIPASLQNRVLGAQAQLWTEHFPSRRHLDYMTYPRACALAQVLRTGENRENWEDFSRRLSVHLERLERLEVAFRPRLTLP